VVKLQRFWIRFARMPYPTAINLGCGVTAYRYDDATAILRDTVFKDETMPPVDCVTEDVDISALDQKHVVPNMEPPVWRGVWFPKGFAFLQ
jgi:hypothetical protein